MTSAVATDQSGLTTLPFGSPLEEVMAVIDKDGGVILEGALSPEQLEVVNQDAEKELAARRCGTIKEDPGQQDFFGMHTKRLTNAITLSPTFREAFVDNDSTIEYAHAMLGYGEIWGSMWLNASQIIEIHPGETEQPLHRDSGLYRVFTQFGPDGPDVIVNNLLALVDVTEDMGATRVIPGSHKWDFDREFTQEMTIPAELKAGSVLLFSGKLVHGGGANITRDKARRVVVSSFNQGFLVPEEAYPFLVPMDEAKKMSPRMQQMIGFRSHYDNRASGGGCLWQHNFEELALHLGMDD
jgi:ectoine hydroxylase-related dioxygenase (phytanoyl-CoA dioxygenase family)